MSHKKLHTNLFGGSLLHNNLYYELFLLFSVYHLFFPLSFALKTVLNFL